MPEDIKRFRLFLVSYAPLWLMLVLRSLSPHDTWRWSDRSALALAFGVLAAWSFYDGHHLVKGAQETGARTLYFADVDDQGGNAAGYLATYLLPFLGLVPAGWGDWASYGVYFVVAAVVFIRTDLTLVNPTLYLYGWRVVSATAYLDQDHDPERQVGDGAAVVVCPRRGSISRGPVRVVTLAGSFVVKGEPG